VPLRLFGGSIRVRVCPGCERDLEPDAAFCSSCFMVFRPEGVSALREFLHGARIPADIYLRRRLQSQDPDAGPVVVAPPLPTASAPAHSAPLPQLEETPQSPPEPVPVLEEPAAAHVVPPPPAAQQPTVASTAETPPVPPKGVDGLLRFKDPLPPPASRPEDVPAVYTWMLEYDPLIPNNLSVLQAIHDAVFPHNPLRQVGYEQHVVLLAADDAGLFVTSDAHNMLLLQLAGAYRRASEAYRFAGEDESAANRALWELASLASRLRISAWVFATRYGQAPELVSPRQRELPLHFAR
jgi:hypothetical protein